MLLHVKCLRPNSMDHRGFCEPRFGIPTEAGPYIVLRFYLLCRLAAALSPMC